MIPLATTSSASPSATRTPLMSVEELAEANASLEGQSAETVLRWAVRKFQPKLLFSTAFGAEGCCLIHILAGIDPTVKMINLDTGYQFDETLAVRDEIRERYGIDVELVKPDRTVVEYEADHGGPLYRIRPDQCCFDRKIVPLRRAVVGFDAWISSIRRDQTSHRAAALPVQWDAKFGLVKINPILDWTHKDVWKFVSDHNVPYNRLHNEGYPSIGCWPCTASVAAGGDERAGRWAGSMKKECGLHVIEHQEGSGI